MTAEEIRNYCAKDKRSLEELVNALIERKGITRSVAKKYFGVKE